MREGEFCDPTHVKITLLRGVAIFTLDIAH